jgi:hypothetical protein
MNSNLDFNEPPERDSQHDEDIAKELADFSRVCVSMAKRLQEGPPLSHLDRLSVENNIAVVQLNYTYWVRKFSDKPHSV